jgi:hypothetical protein
LGGFTFLVTRVSSCICAFYPQKHLFYRAFSTVRACLGTDYQEPVKYCFGVDAGSIINNYGL